MLMPKMENTEEQIQKKTEGRTNLAFHFVFNKKQFSQHPWSLVSGCNHFTVCVFLCFFKKLYFYLLFRILRAHSPPPSPPPPLFDFSSFWANFCYSGKFVIMKSWNNLKYSVTVNVIFKCIWQESTVINTFYLYTYKNVLWLYTYHKLHSHKSK